MKVSRFKTNAAKEQNGVWVDIGEGAKLLVARVNNSHYRSVLLRRSKPVAAQMRTGTLPEDKARAILEQCYADAILLDWEGLEDDDGNALEYSKEQALELLRMKDFFEMVENFAMNAELYREEQLNEMGNS